MSEWKTLEFQVQTRTYDFGNGITKTINKIFRLKFKNGDNRIIGQGGHCHYLTDIDGNLHYIPSGWIGIDIQTGEIKDWTSKEIK